MSEISNIFEKFFIYIKIYSLIEFKITFGIKMFLKIEISFRYSTGMSTFEYKYFQWRDQLITVKAQN